MKIFTIGFCKKDAKSFFNLLKSNPINKLIDVRLNNTSQLSGFTKKNDLKYFLDEISNINYLHEISLAPDELIFKQYKNKRIDWNTYKRKYLQLLQSRQIENHLSPELIHQSCLLCSEHDPTECHRSLIGQYLSQAWRIPIEIIDL